MPTVLLIDASLSMCRPVELADRPEPMQLRHLAADGLNHLLQYMAIHCKLEFCSIAFVSIGESSYVSWQGRLTCGHLSSHVTLCPPPEPQPRRGPDAEADQPPVRMTEQISIVGFMNIGDVAHPATVSRHLVLPIPAPKTYDTSDSSGGIVGGIDSQENSSSLPSIGEIKAEPAVTSDSGDGVCSNVGSATGDENDGKQASFCVLLHGSLKVESMVAIARIGPSWYGMLYSWADSKKKSNLMLSTFEPGENSVPWWCAFKNLGSANLNGIPSTWEKLKLPLKPLEKPSYSQNSVVWIRTTGLQADIQKILRHARKLPEKIHNFYKELNRVRRAAISYGFTDLLEALSSILERECTLLPGTAHPDAALQLSHAANQLKPPANGSGPLPDADVPIAPLRTKYFQNMSE
ncbi:integrator complex subunit 14-like isoform X2 [Varroa jacobsoni]|uniref:Integrator complex subunit 14 n=1 Tax=Varroa destructor TaxID=109461 RepID=A0A7M7KS63_VARDE|nr:integrator complex subunit 14-like isoform X3 [Varroa destructor]XP_022709901.1 integrator complex subunit 14-like isoform X2 [Varroa jacobsoni]